MSLLQTAASGKGRVGDVAELRGSAGVPARKGSGRMIEVAQIESRHLAGNLLGDPSRRDLVVYLPPGYQTAQRRYPVAYLLHGFGRRSTSWIAGPLVERGAFRQWIDSPVNGNFEQYVTREVVNWVDGHYRTVASRDSRGVFGISSGGLGAWHLGSRNPDVSGAMMLLSADSYFEVTHKPWLYRFYNAVYPSEPRGPINGNLDSWFAYGLAACYTPNTANPPFYSDLPVEFPSA